jgi:sulfur-oxidizing protein SoxY
MAKEGYGVVRIARRTVVHYDIQIKEIDMQNRRDVLSHSATVAAMLAAVGLLPGLAQAQAAGYNTAAFAAKTLLEVMKALGAGTPAESKDVSITGPDIAENGAVVPVGAAASLPGVKRLLLLVDKNPSMLAAMFDVTDAIEANISTRVKMGQSSDVYAVAMMNDGKVLFARKEIKVTLGGCGG